MNVFFKHRVEHFKKGSLQLINIPIMNFSFALLHYLIWPYKMNGRNNLFVT